MANNKVQLSDGTTLMDLTQDTVTPQTLLSGATAHNAAGEQISGVIKAELPKSCLVTLSASGWDAATKQQTVTVNGIIADEATQRVLPAPAPSSVLAYRDANVWCIAQAANAVTFICDTVPSANLKVYVTWETVEDVTFYPPEKGTIISMDLDGNGEKEYRILSADGSVAKVMAMYDDLTSAYNSSSTTTTFGSITAQKYEDSTLDTYLNTTWYGTLKDSVKAAILPENVVQHCYRSYDEPNTPNTPTYTYQFQYNWDDDDYENADDVGNVTVGDRKVFAIDLMDVFDYFDKACITSDELMTLFHNQATAVANFIWLRSSDADTSNYAWRVNGGGGRLNSGVITSPRVVRPALNLDLSQIPFTIVGGSV